MKKRNKIFTFVMFYNIFYISVSQIQFKQNKYRSNGERYQFTSNFIKLVNIILIIYTCVIPMATL